MKFVIRLTLILIAALTFQEMSGQEGITFKGILTEMETSEPLSSGTVTVKVNGKDIASELTDATGTYNITVPIGFTYTLHFSKSGYVPKYLTFETSNVPIFGDGKDYFQFYIPTPLYKMKEGFNLEIMDDPVGLIYFVLAENSFTYDELYAKGMTAKISAEFERLKKIESEKEKLKIELDSLTNRGDDYMAEKKYNDALNAYSDALQLSPNDEKIQRKYNEAEKANERTVYPIEIEKQFELYISKAEKAMRSKKWKTAKKYYSKALELKPEESLPQEKIQEIEGILRGQKK